MKKNQSKDGSAANAALNLLEELLWTLSSSDIGSLRKGLAELRKSLVYRESDDFLGTASKSESNSKLLIGILPNLLADEKIFPSNQDIERFAREAFSISITRWEKRSRYEMIGMLVMEVNLLPNDKLAELVRALTKLVARDDAIKDLRESVSRTGFSWNETIRRLAER